MKKEIIVCDVCGKEATDEKQLRKENWIELHGGTDCGVKISLDKSRGKNTGLLHKVGREDREYHFCSLDCFITALKARDSI